MSVTGSVDDQANIKNGTEAATTGIATSYQGSMDVTRSPGTSKACRSRPETMGRRSPC